jgi:hypothetical protein
VKADVPPFAIRGVLGIAGVVAVLHCTATAFGSGHWFDEVYMLAGITWTGGLPISRR